MEFPEGDLPFMRPKPKLLHKGVLAEIEGLGFPGSSPKLWLLLFWAQNCGLKANCFQKRHILELLRRELPSLVQI